MRLKGGVSGARRIDREQRKLKVRKVGRGQRKLEEGDAPVGDVGRVVLDGHRRIGAIVHGFVGTIPDLGIIGGGKRLPAPVAALARVR